MKILKSLFSVSIATVFVRLVGFIRDLFVADIFGADSATDSFFVAFKVPNTLRYFFAEGIFQQILVPKLTEKKNKESLVSLKKFISDILGIIILLLIIISLIGIIIAPWIILVIAPGLKNNISKFHTTVVILQITFPYILLISLSTFVGSILNIWKFFFIPSISPIFLNISIVVFTVYLSYYFTPHILALSWAVLIGGVLQLIFQLPALKKINMLILPSFSFSLSKIAITLYKVLPIIVGGLTNQVSMILNSIASSFLTSGSISWMYYASRIIELPSGIFSIALSTVLISSMTEKFSINKYEDHCNLMNWGLKLCFILITPSCFGIVILAKPLIISLFKYGKFTIFDVLMTQRSLVAYSVGLLGISLTKILSLWFYSCQDIKTPLKMAIITIVINQCMNYMLISSFKHVGLSLSAGISSLINATLLYWQIKKKKTFFLHSNWLIFIIKLLTSIIVMVSVLLFILYFTNVNWSEDCIFHRLIKLISIISISCISYFYTLYILNIKALL